ncbi:MAG: FUSC family protein, partial [Chromatiales bacterium]
TPVLTETVSSLADAQRRLLGHYVAVLADAREDPEALKLRAQATGAVARLPAVVDGAELDSFETWEARHLWRRCAKDFAALNETMERWRQGFPDLERLDLGRLMPGLSVLGPELDARLGSVARMLAGQPPQRSPADIVLEFDAAALDTLPRFDRAVLLRSRDQLQRIDRLTRALFSTIADIQGFGTTSRDERPTDTSAPAWTIDLDRLVYAVRAFTAVWIVLLACIYVPDFPMPGGVIPVAAAVSIMLALMPQFPVLSLAVPVVGVVAYAGVFHILVMPHLSSFVGLGTAIFIAIFLVMIVFAKPQQAMIRGIGTSMFVMVISVKNEQTYDFLFVVNFGLMFVLALIAVWVSTWFPISLGPAHVISKQLGRFFGSCERLASPRRQDAEQPLRRMWFAFDLHEVTTLPGKIGRWMAALPAAAFGKGSPAQARDLVDALQALGDRMRELVEVRRAPQSATLVRDLTTDVHAWRVAIQEILRRLAVDPASVEAGQLRAGLDAKLEVLEGQIEKAINAAPQGGASPEEADNMYRVLGAYRGVSEALVEVTRRAARIDWECLREGRF